MSISWVLFTSDLCLSSMFTAAAYVIRRRQTREQWQASKFQYANLAATLILSELSVSALVFVSIGVTAFSESVGYAATGLFSSLALAVFVGWVCLCM